MKWEPIKPPAPSDAAIYVGDVDALSSIFDARRSAALAHGYDVAAMLERHKRELAIETGLLERLYSLDRGTTTLLIEHGLVEENLARSSTNLAPDHLIGLLHDQKQAIEIVFDWVSQSRPLSSSGLKELHHVLTKRQEGVDVLDQFGRSHTMPLRRGEWKVLPNNPVRPNGQTHEYCPPEQVAPEIDRLLSMYADRSLSLHPFVRACWLHHRFTEIHPFQDGNGRVARCLLNYVLIEAGHLPVVVSNDDRLEYILALEAADAGALEPLVRFIANVHVQKMTRLLADLDWRVQTPERPRSASEASEDLAAKLYGSLGNGSAGAEEIEDIADILEPLIFDLTDVLSELVDAANEPFTRRGAVEPLEVADAHTDPDPEHAAAIWESLGRADRLDGWGDPISAVWDVVRRELIQLGFRVQPNSGWNAGRVTFHDDSLGGAQMLGFNIVPARHPVSFEPWSPSEPWIIVATSVVHGRVTLAIRDLLIYTLGEPPERIVDRFRPFADRALRAFLESIAPKPGRRTPPGR